MVNSGLFYSQNLSASSNSSQFRGGDGREGRTPSQDSREAWGLHHAIRGAKCQESTRSFEQFSSKHHFFYPGVQNISSKMTYLVASSRVNLWVCMHACMHAITLVVLQANASLVDSPPDWNSHSPIRRIRTLALKHAGEALGDMSACNSDYRTRGKPQGSSTTALEEVEHRDFLGTPIWSTSNDS